MQTFTYGPFLFEPSSAFNVAGKQCRRWAMKHVNTHIATLTLDINAVQSEIIDAFSSARTDYTRALMSKHAPDKICLVDIETDEEIAHFYSDHMCGMTPGLIDDRSRYWLRSTNRLYSRGVTLTQFAQIASEFSAPPFSWICGVLPNAVLTDDHSEWRPPSNLEIRHVVGEGSFTGVSGAKAAELVGVTPQNFRKYTARDDASTRQNISFAMWHMLLYKLGVKRL